MGKIVKAITFAITALLCVSSTFAAPAKRTKITVKQSDGTELVVSQRGDEHFHFFVTDDELPLVRNVNGDFYHAVVENGNIVTSGIMAHAIDQRTEQERLFIAKRGDISNSLGEIWQKKMEKRNAERARRANKTRVGNITRYEGNKRGLVILVNFADNNFTVPSPQEHFQRKLNEKGYSENNSHDCASQYFSDQSNGMFNLTFDVVGPYTLSKEMAYYGGNDTSGNDTNPRDMIAEACQLASSDVDYADYDWYGDGNVDMVFVVYAGYGESQCADPNTVWPHQWELSGKALTINGKKINTYACSCELAGETGSTTPDGIGSFCHEFSHCLGLPDFYDTRSGEAFGMADWSLMHYGTYLGENMNGECPCNYTAYERWACGWNKPTELSSPTTITDMPSLSSGNNGYIIYNDACEDEYYILDNRQKQGWDSYLPGHGLLITHVDYDQTKWYYNNVNTETSHQRCTIFHADNRAGDSDKDLAGDPYPGIMGNHNLTDTSRPSATLFNKNSEGKKVMGKPITEITESNDGLISFKFMGGTEAGINDAIFNGNDSKTINPNYRQWLPKGIRLEWRDNKTIKVIDKK